MHRGGLCTALRVTFSIAFGIAFSHREPRASPRPPSATIPWCPLPMQCSAGAAKALQCSAAGLRSVCCLLVLFFSLAHFFLSVFCPFEGKLSWGGWQLPHPPAALSPVHSIHTHLPSPLAQEQMGVQHQQHHRALTLTLQTPMDPPGIPPCRHWGSSASSCILGSGNPSSDPFIAPIPIHSFNPQSLRKKKWGPELSPCNSPQAQQHHSPHCPWHGGKGMGIYGQEEGRGCSHPYHSLPGQSRVHGQEVGAARDHKDQNHTEVWGHAEGQKTAANHD